MPARGVNVPTIIVKASAAQEEKVWGVGEGVLGREEIIAHLTNLPSPIPNLTWRSGCVLGGAEN